MTLYRDICELTVRTADTDFESVSIAMQCRVSDVTEFKLEEYAMHMQVISSQYSFL